MWKPIHQRPFFMRHKRKQPRRLVQEVPSIFLPMPMTEELHRENIIYNDIEIGHCCMQGWRANMEDQFIIDNFTVLNDHLIVAIFDGHSGTYAAEYCSANLKTKIEESDAWKEYAKLSVKERSDNIAKLGEALLQAYLQIDEGLLSLKKDSLMPDESGCTAVTCIITPSHVVCANVGDSRAVIGMRDKTVDLTDDHKPENPEERARIEAAGGFVEANRVMGELAMSRAIGDFRYKVVEGLSFHEQLVIAVPDISIHERSRTEDHVLVVACDGVWDEMTNDEAVVFVQQYIEKPAAFSIHQYAGNVMREGLNLADVGDSDPASKRRKLNAADDDSAETSSSSSSSEDEENGGGSDKLEPTALNAASALISVALAKGSMDNISAIVVKFPAVKELEAKHSKKK